MRQKHEYKYYCPLSFCIKMGQYCKNCNGYIIPPKGKKDVELTQRMKYFLGKQSYEMSKILVNKRW